MNNQTEQRYSETLIITKDGWMYLRNLYAEQRGFKPKDDATLERMYNRIKIKNNASEYFPIEENEIRVDKNSGYTVEQMIEILTAAKLPCRIDGYRYQYMSI